MPRTSRWCSSAGTAEVFGIYDEPDDRFTFAVQEFDDRDRAERVARKMTEKHEANRFQRIVCFGRRIG